MFTVPIILNDMMVFKLVAKGMILLLSVNFGTCP
jgi:hypothetical protein